MSRDAEKHEFRGSLSIACGRKINLGNYESAELHRVTGMAHKKI